MTVRRKSIDAIMSTLDSEMPKAASDVRQLRARNTTDASRLALIETRLDEIERRLSLLDGGGPGGDPGP